MTTPPWTGRTENRLAAALCAVAHNGTGVCMDHIRQARIALDHLAREGLLVTEAPVAESPWSGC